LIFMLM
jgi:hypothetical protein